MVQVLHTVADLSYWLGHLPVYLQVFLGMLAFFLMITTAGFLMHGLLLMSQRIRLQLSLTGVVGYIITIFVGWLLYISVPFWVLALGDQQQLDMRLLIQTVGPYFSIFLLLSVSLIDALKTNGKWIHKKLPLPAQFFTAGIWLLALGIPAIRSVTKHSSTC